MLIHESVKSVLGNYLGIWQRRQCNDFAPDKIFLTLLFCAVCFLPLGVAGEATVWTIEKPRPGVVVLRNEKGNWAGINPDGILALTKQSVIIRKEFDLAALPHQALTNANYAAIRMHIGIVDWGMTKPNRGLNETFLIRINGHAMKLPTNDPRFPATSDPKKKRQQGWMDLPFPVEWLKSTGKLVFEMNKIEQEPNDDFIYQSFDHTAVGNNSFVSFNGGKNWSSAKNKAHGNSEFMIRLVLSEQDPIKKVIWRPTESQLDDSEKVIAFNKHDRRIYSLELHRELIDFARCVQIKVKCSGVSPEVSYQCPGGESAQRLPMVNNGIEFVGKLPDGVQPFALFFDKPDNAAINEIIITYSPSTSDQEKPINLAPAIAAPHGQRKQIDSNCRIVGDTAVIETPTITATFRLRPRLEIISLKCAEIAADVLRYPKQTRLFRLKLGTNQVFDCRDLDVKKIIPLAHGFAAELELPEAGLVCQFTAKYDNDELRLGLTVKNNGSKNAKFTIAFPHLDGLVLSSQPESDFYLFPWGGGIISDRATRLRSLYGDGALWQMVDLFSPERGGGLYLRSDDATGSYKGINLRKSAEIPTGFRMMPHNCPGRCDLSIQYTDALEEANGLGVAFEYQRYERAPGAEVKLPDSCMGTHAGNWKKAMQLYATWSAGTWPQRPWPSKLTSHWNINCGHNLSKPICESYKKWDERFKKQVVEDQRNIDIYEFVSYWTVSELGPWNTPIKDIATLGSAAAIQHAKGFGYTRDPVTGKEVYTLNRGDYDGYNPQWGGLPVFRKMIEQIQSFNKLVTLYTAPIIPDYTSRFGKAHSADWAVINPAWHDPLNCLKNPPEPVGAVHHYFTRCMCVNNPDFSTAIAESMARLCRDTGADGIRLDEYGYSGYICLSRKHQHVFPEPGHNVWLQATARNVRAIHAAMDQIKPNLVLMTEFAGNDQIAANLEGALSYDACEKINQLRPFPVDLFRFYFKKCKLFGINVGGPKNFLDYCLFNGVGTFNSPYSTAYVKLLTEHDDAFNGKAEPLVDTLVAGVYANRFSALDGRKTIYTIMNVVGNTIDAPILQAENSTDFYYVDLLTGKEILPVKTVQGYVLKFMMHDKELRCIGKLPRK